LQKFEEVTAAQGIILHLHRGDDAWQRLLSQCEIDGRSSTWLYGHHCAPGNKTAHFDPDRVVARGKIARSKGTRSIGSQCQGLAGGAIGH
jgi:hypothetical protein